MKFKPTLLVGKALEKSTGMAEIQARIDTMLMVQRLLAKNWPQMGLRVISIREETLAVATANAALAAKCRQIEPSVLRAVKRQLPHIEHVRFKPKKDFDPAARPANVVKPGISAENLDRLHATAEHLEAGPVRDALLRLVQNRRT